MRRLEEWGDRGEEVHAGSYKKLLVYNEPVDVAVMLSDRSWKKQLRSVSSNFMQNTQLIITWMEFVITFRVNVSKTKALNATKIR